MYRTFKYNANVQLSEHLNSNMFRCKCSGKHDFKINMDLVDLIEDLMPRIGAVSVKVISGYRCRKHDKKVGGSGKATASHVRGDAGDIRFYDKNGKAIPSRVVCLELEKMGHIYGIGYRGGGTPNTNGETHIDVKKRKWYGDESKSFSRAVCTSFYDYFGIPKIPNKYGKEVYVMVNPRYIRTGPGTEFRIKRVKELTKDGQRNCVNTRSSAKAQYKKGTKFDVLEVTYGKNKSVWARTPSGYLCLESSSDTMYVKLK